MPLYAYRCNACGSDFDARRSIDERDDISCPTCGGSAQRLLATIAAIGSQPEPGPGFCSPARCADRQGAGLPCGMA